MISTLIMNPTILTRLDAVERRCGLLAALCGIFALHSAKSKQELEELKQALQGDDLESARLGRPERPAPVTVISAEMLAAKRPLARRG